MNTTEKVFIGIGVGGVVLTLGILMGKIYLDSQDIEYLERLVEFKNGIISENFQDQTLERRARYEERQKAREQKIFDVLNEAGRIDSRGKLHEKMQGGKRHRKTHGKKNRSERRRN